MIRMMVVVMLLALVTPGLSHDGKHDKFLESLTNQNNVSCCVGSEAYSVDEPDWEYNKDENYPYRVRQSPKHDWLTVPSVAVVKQRNEIGLVKVWPTVNGTTGDWTTIRCFLPGTGT